MQTFHVFCLLLFQSINEKLSRLPKRQRHVFPSVIQPCLLTISVSVHLAELLHALQQERTYRDSSLDNLDIPTHQNNCLMNGKMKTIRS